MPIKAGSMFFIFLFITVIESGIYKKRYGKSSSIFLNTIVHTRNFEAVLLGWSLALTPDAYPLWHSSSSKLGGFNLVSYSNPEVDKLIEQGINTINRDELGVIYKDIFRKISDDLPYLFLYIPDSITVVNKNIKNIEPSVIGIMHNQKDWEIEK